MEPQAAIEVIARCIEAAGVLAIVGGGLLAIALGARRLRTLNGTVVYRAFRHDLGRAILVGLELLVAADIVQTIGDRPSLYDLAALGAIVAIRTALSFTLEVELDGRWPWQRAEAPEHRSSSASASEVTSNVH